MNQAISTDVQQVLTIIKWVVGLMVPVLTALCTTVVVLWKKLGEKSRKCDEDKDRLQKEWRDQIQAIAREHKAEMKEVWKKQTDLLVQVNRTIEYALKMPPERTTGGADG